MTSPHAGSRKVLPFLAIVAELLLLVLVIHVFNIETSSGFVALTPFLFFGFIVHAWLPMRYRLPFFVVLTLVSILALFGWTAGLWLIALSLALIGAAHLPIPFWYRVAVVVAIAVGLALLREGIVQTPWAGMVVPIVSAIFMFRIMLYLYDLRHENSKATIWQRLGYFFMLPNIVFPLFPVVDYKTFLRTYYNKDDLHIYRQGVLWMFRGVFHLLLYRVVYQALPDMEALPGLAGVFLGMAFTFGLYLRVSGLFHLIVGILCLFGFNLPETHHLYFLSSSFVDFWRRINIYWKDYMMKLFFYPVYMRLRNLGLTTALVLATLVVFVGTWFLHSYQWFWLRGDFPVTPMDLIFWGFLGVTVAVNSVMEANRGRKRVLTRPKWSLRESAVLSAKTVTFFVMMCVLWSLWNAESLESWWLKVRRLSESGPGDYLIGLGLVALAVGVGVAVQYGLARTEAWRKNRKPVVGWGMAFRSVVMVLLLLPSVPLVYKMTSHELKSTLALVKSDGLNSKDAERLEQGYYETLTRTGSFGSKLWEQQVTNTLFWEPLETTGASRVVEGKLYPAELVPGTTVSFKGAELKTNRWGMRDREYTREKPAGTYRIALLGASNPMGSGVANDQVAENLVEERLNREHAGDPVDHYEILNFSVAGYGLLQQVGLVHTDRVYAFDPDAVFYVAHPRELRRTIRRFVQAISRGIPEEYPFLHDVIRQAGVTPDMSTDEQEERLTPYAESLVKWGYDQLASESRAHGAIPVWVYWPTLDADDDVDLEEVAYLSGLAREAGMVPLSMQDAFKGRDRVSLRIARWDSHANAEGHQLLAEQLYRQIWTHRDEIGMTAPAPAVTQHAAEPAAALDGGD